jgi:hypothetical protein
MFSGLPQSGSPGQDWPWRPGHVRIRAPFLGVRAARCGRVRHSKAAAEKAGWQSRPSPRKDRTGNKVGGRGIAYAQRNGTRVAVVAEVDIDRASGKIWARKFTVAHDCGQIIQRSHGAGDYAAAPYACRCRRLPSEISPCSPQETRAHSTLFADVTDMC